MREFQFLCNFSLQSVSFITLDLHLSCSHSFLSIHTLSLVTSRPLFSLSHSHDNLCLDWTLLMVITLFRSHTLTVAITSFSLDLDGTLFSYILKLSFALILFILLLLSFKFNFFLSSHLYHNSLSILYKLSIHQRKYKQSLCGFNTQFFVLNSTTCTNLYTCQRVKNILSSYKRINNLTLNLFSQDGQSVLRDFLNFTRI